MVVVTLVAVLATVALAFFRSHATAARAVEATAMIETLRAAEERYRALNGVYFNASVSGNWYPRDPTAAAIRGSDQQAFYFPAGSAAHADAARFLRLGAVDPGPVRMGYLVTAGLAGTTPTALEFVIPGQAWTVSNDSWFVIQAVSDLDDDGTPGYYVASSYNGNMLTLNDGE